MKTINPLYTCLLLLSLSACQGGPEPINLGEDYCHYCKMGIVDPKFGGELITSRGRVYKFDAIECMIPFILENSNIEFKEILCVPFDAPNTLVSKDKVHFRQSKKYKSPMGKNIAALLKSDLDGEYQNLSWKEIKSKLSPNHN